MAIVSLSVKPISRITVPEEATKVTFARHVTHLHIEVDSSQPVGVRIAWPSQALEDGVDPISADYLLCEPGQQRELDIRTLADVEGGGHLWVAGDGGVSECALMQLVRKVRS